MNTMEPKVGYIDEYGDKSIDYKKDGVSTFFIVTAIVIDAENETNYSQRVAEIRKKFTQAPEIKSKNFSDKDFSKRLNLLSELIQLDFYIYSIVVDKRRIWENSGLAFRNTFFKYINRIFDLELYRYYPFLELRADEHGDDKFMNGFISYFNKHHYQTELFRSPSFKFARSEDEPLIQVADFISGSLSKFFDPKKEVDNADKIMDIIKPKILHLREWPEMPLELYKSIGEDDYQFNQEIAEFSQKIINDYLVEMESETDEIIIQQTIILNYLLFRFKNNPFEYVYTDELIQRIKQRKQTALSTQLFRNKIIANLRDKGIIIVSSQNGYKIPCSKADIISYFNRNNQIIKPMLSRIEMTNRLIKIATDNKIDILEFSEFHDLSEMIKISKNKAK